MDRKIKRNAKDSQAKKIHRKETYDCNYCFKSDGHCLNLQCLIPSVSVQAYQLLSIATYVPRRRRYHQQVKGMNKLYMDHELKCDIYN